MLLISRREGQRFVVRFGDREAWLTVCDISGGKVQVGIEAPRDVEVVREELLPEGERRGETK